MITDRTEWNREIANWIINIVMGVANKLKKSVDELNTTPSRLRTIMELWNLGIITRKEAKELIWKVEDRNKDPVDILAEDKTLLKPMRY